MSNLDLELLRGLYDLNTIAAQAIGKSIRNGSAYLCPFPHHAHHHNTPSFSVYPRRDGRLYFKCKGACGAYGDVVDFMGFMTLGAGYDAHNPEHVYAAARALGQRDLCPPRPMLKAERRALNPVYARLRAEEWSEALATCSPAQDYLEQRGVLSVARRFRLGYRHVPPENAKRTARGQTYPPLPGHYISIPHLRDGTVHGIKLRRIDSHPEYVGMPEAALPLRYDALSGSRAIFFNFDQIAFQSGALFIPEGEFDMLLMVALGYMAGGDTAGASSMESFDETLRLATTYATPIFVEDPDEAGRKASQRRLKWFGRGTIANARDRHDVGDLYAHGGPDAVRTWAEETIHASLGHQGTTLRERVFA